METPSGAPMPHLDGVSHRDVGAAGIRFHVAEAGAGDPILLLHGWPQHWWTWRKLIPLLASDHRVICPDLRGFGWSDVPPAGYEKQALADDVVAILDALELESVNLIAHDWGAWVGYLVALGHPQRIRRYVPLNMPTPWPDPPSVGGLLGIWRIWYMGAISTPGLGGGLIRHTDFVRRVITAGAVHPDAWEEADIESFCAVLREPARADASVQLYRTFLLREVRPFLAGANRGRRLTMPTLGLHGAHDLAMDPTRLGDWRTWADEMEIELRDDSGHFIAEELPDLVAARARALFSGASPADAMAEVV